jgi:hypothetical protein
MGIEFLKKLYDFFIKEDKKNHFQRYKVEEELKEKWALKKIKPGDCNIERIIINFKKYIYICYHCGFIFSNEKEIHKHSIFDYTYFLCKECEKYDSYNLLKKGKKRLND